jgi:hypothetical protein
VDFAKIGRHTLTYVGMPLKVLSGVWLPLASRSPERPAESVNCHFFNNRYLPFYHGVAYCLFPYFLVPKLELGSKGVGTDAGLDKYSPNPDEPEPPRTFSIPCHFAQDLIDDGLRV